MARTRNIGQLFVDESGCMESTSDTMVVGGLLLSTPPGSSDVRELRQLMDSFLPWVSYPPHQTQLNRQSGLVASWHRLDEARRAEVRTNHPEIAQTLDAGAEHIARLDGAEATSFHEATRRRREPDVGVLATLDRQLPPAHKKALRDLGEHTRSRVTQLLSVLHDTLPEGCVVVAAAGRVDESNPDEVLLPSPDHLQGDPYLELLETMFERVFALSRSSDAPFEIKATVAQRRVGRAQGFPASLLTARDVGTVVRRAARFPPSADGLGDARARVIPQSPPAYDDQAHPLLVLADAVVNRLRHTLITSRPAISYSGIDQHARQTIAVPLRALTRWRTGSPWLPSMATYGECRRQISATFQGHDVDVPAAAHRWQVDQAQEWITAGRHWRGRL